jgi:hypothetical protein
MGSYCAKPEHLVLAEPFGRHVGETDKIIPYHAQGVLRSPP